MATGTSIGGSSSAFHVDDPEQASGYRTLSVPAILSLVLGLASPLCFGAPLLFVIPIAGIAISLFALIRIDSSGGSLAGRPAAVVGLVLSIAMVVAPTTRAYVLEHVRTKQAIEFADSWLNDVVSGQTEKAFKLTNDSLKGTPPPDPAHQSEKPADPYDTFRAQPLIKALLALGADAQIQRVGVSGYDPHSFEQVFVQTRYEVKPVGSKPGAAPVTIVLTLQHGRLAREGRSRWMVYAFDDGSKPTSIPAPSPF
ncbi:MAG TPA: hypothetical protein VH107_02640 [Lacipirellulaceae bacterium]|jgi:hypothetical protein|nr:hypothetical protein [Lacipirellulaceae bacterium]